MTHDPTVLDLALPPPEPPLKPEALPPSEQIDQLAQALAQVRHRCRLVILEEEESALLGAPLTPRETEVLLQLRDLFERFPGLAAALGGSPRWFSQLCERDVALEQMEEALAGLENAERSAQALTLRAITTDLDQAEQASQGQPAAELLEMTFEPLFHAQDLSRIRALARAQRTRNQAPAEPGETEKP